MTVLIIGAAKLLGNKLLEQQIAKENHKQEVETGLLKAKNALEEKKAALDKAKLDIAEAKRQRKLLLDEKKRTAQVKIRNIEDDKSLSTEEKEKRKKEIEDEIQKIEEENRALDAHDERLIASYERQIKNGEDIVASYEAQQNAILANSSALMGYVNAFKSTFTSVANYARSIVQVINKISDASKAAKVHNEANSASTIPMIGWIIALVIEGVSLIATIISVVTSVIGFINAQQEKAAKSAENTSKSILELGNTIYRLNERKNHLNKVIDEFEVLDNRIIKTKEDVERLNELIDTVPDKLDDQDVDDDKDIGYGKGVNQKEAFELLRQSGASGEELLRWLANEEKKTEEDLHNKRWEQVKELDELRESNFAEYAKMFSENPTDTNIITAQGYIRGAALETIYNDIDEMKEAGNATRKEALALENVLTNLFQSGGMHLYDMFAHSTQACEDLVTGLQKLQIEVENTNGELEKITVSEIMDSDDYGIAEKTRAYRLLAKELKNNVYAYNALQKAYSGYDVFAEMNDATLEALDKYNITISKINQFQDSYDMLAESGLKMTKEQYKNAITDRLLPVFAATNGNIEQTIDAVFGQYIGDIKQYEDLYNNIVTSFSNLIGEGVLNISQSVTKLKNSISSVYETASK
jgi:DNA repair exonuclease SbcCD ATPase subunit